MEDRIAHLQREYVLNWNGKEDAQFQERMLHLKKHIQGPIYGQILEHVRLREFPEAIKLLLNHRYDKCYDKSILRQINQFKDSIPMSMGLQAACQRILNLAESIRT